MKRSRQSGVSLLEALVSLAVMAIGAVAVVGMQATLRSNADLAKQRSEAVRLAQQKIEEWRGFTSMAAVGGEMDWTDVVDTIDPGLVGSSATFDRAAAVVTRGAGDDDPLSKTVTMTVTWTDRTGQGQVVELRTLLSGVPPELAGSLSVDLTSSLLPNTGGRHPGIPEGAVGQTDGTSIFSPPGAPPGTQWIFDNITGVIRNVCTPSCPLDPTPAQFVTGFVRFALGSSPGAAQAESPADAPLSIAMLVDQDSPVDQDVACYQTFESTYVEYFCAVPVITGSTAWTGKVLVDESTLPTVSAVSSSDASKHRVCRYTPVRGCHPAVGSTIWGGPGLTASCSGASPTPQRKMSNQEHPLIHVAVSAPLVNQNFLIIRAGDGSTAYDCPDDNPATPAVQGTTWHHQPAS